MKCNEKLLLEYRTKRYAILLRVSYGFDSRWGCQKIPYTRVCGIFSHFTIALSAPSISSLELYLNQLNTGHRFFCFSSSYVRLSRLRLCSSSQPIFAKHLQKNHLLPTYRQAYRSYSLSRDPLHQRQGAFSDCRHRYYSFRYPSRKVRNDRPSRG